MADSLLRKLRNWQLRPTTPWVAALLFILSVVASAPPWAQDSTLSAPDIGLLTDPAGMGLIGGANLPNVLVEDPRRAPRVRVPIRWIEGEPVAGRYEWSALDQRIDSLSDRGYRIGLIVDPEHPTFLPTGGAPDVASGTLEPWTRFVRAAVARYASKLEMIQIGNTLEGMDATGYGFMLKSVSLAAVAEATRTGHELRVAQAAVRPEDLAVQRELWDNGSAAYVNILPVHISPAAPDAGLEHVGGLLNERLQHPPASDLWVGIAAPREIRDADRISLALQALDLGADHVAPAIREDDAKMQSIGAWVNRVQSLLGEGYAPAPIGMVSIEDGDGTPIGEARVLARFFGERDFSTLIFYAWIGDMAPLSDERLIVESRFAREGKLREFVNGSSLRVAPQSLPDGQKGKALRITRGPYPQAVQFLQAPVNPDFELPAEQVELTRTRDLSAEEVIARHQQVNKVQEDGLDRWIARGRVDLHFRLAQGSGTIDLGIESNYFWERGKQLEWEQTDYFINGNKLGWKKVPELPLIQPEKVVTLPLDLTLNKTYRYRSSGRDRVDGRDAYVLQFQPTDPDAAGSLYRGSAWIDAETFELLKTSVVQTGLEAPVLSNEEVDRFAAISDESGQTFRLLDTIDGQQTWNATGRTFVVVREVRFSKYEINPPLEDFERRRAAAYASENQMLRDTEQGFRYLERTEDGERIVKDKADTSQLFAAAGALSNTQSQVIPIAGVNYFNYDLFKKGIQTNIFFAGPFLFATASKPDLAGGRLDLTADLNLWGIQRADEFFSDGLESRLERVDQRPQNFNLRLGYPIKDFLKINLIGNVGYRGFDLNDTSEELLRMRNEEVGATRSLRTILPENHIETGGTLSVEFNRRGYSFVGQSTVRSRSDWEPFGLFDDNSGQFVGLDAESRTLVDLPDAELNDSYTRWKITGFKEWYLPKFQKIRIGVDHLNGEDLDRWSRYQFSFFGDDRLWGYSGSGVRFDEGTIGRLGYAFNLFEIVQLDIAVDHGRVEDLSQLIGEQSFTGAGFTSNFVGPWKTVINLSYGYAIDSDIPDLEGESELFLAIFKLF